MRRPSESPPAMPDHPVWVSLSHYSIGPEGAALAFDQRLAREQGWSEEFTARVIEEYRRFCFLAVTHGSEVTPSDSVDQVWHLHLTYTRDYWDRFCPDVLGTVLHHGPTAGGSGERNRFFEQYARTLRAYEAVFGTPPADIWPDAARRLLDDPRARRVHPRDGLLVRRSILFVWAVLAVIVGIAIGVVLSAIGG